MECRGDTADTMMPLIPAPSQGKHSAACEIIMEVRIIGMSTPGRDRESSTRTVRSRTPDMKPGCRNFGIPPYPFGPGRTKWYLLVGGPGSYRSPPLAFLQHPAIIPGGWHNPLGTAPGTESLDIAKISSRAVVTELLVDRDVFIGKNLKRPKRC